MQLVDFTTFTEPTENRKLIENYNHLLNLICEEQLIMNLNSTETCVEPPSCDLCLEIDCCPDNSKLRTKMIKTICQTSMINPLIFRPKLSGKVKSITKEELSIFEDSLDTFISPFRSNARKTGFLIGQCCENRPVRTANDLSNHISTGETLTMADLWFYLRIATARSAGFKLEKYPSIKKLERNIFAKGLFIKSNSTIRKIVRSKKLSVWSIFILVLIPFIMTACMVLFLTFKWFSMTKLYSCFAVKMDNNEDCRQWSGSIGAVWWQIEF